MSKMIKITPEDLDKLRSDFDTILRSIKVFDGKISYTKVLDNVPRKATLSFTERAYMKMLALVRNFDSEVAWHGTATRGDDPTKDEYIISDIFVYPQEVGAATVTDQGEYYKWLRSEEMEDVFEDIRMQGHSHVNMSVSPSDVDNAMYEQILSMFDDEDFYIFIIWNKRNEKTIKIYDMKKNVMFETGDVAINVVDDGTGIQKFLETAREMVKEKRYTPTPTPAVSAYPSYKTPTYQSPALMGVPKTPATDATRTPVKHKKKKPVNSTTKGGFYYDSQRI